eukprot:6479470-Amphidinium_carterae.1
MSHLSVHHLQDLSNLRLYALILRKNDDNGEQQLGATNRAVRDLKLDHLGVFSTHLQGGLSQPV